MLKNQKKLHIIPHEENREIYVSFLHNIDWDQEAKPLHIYNSFQETKSHKNAILRKKALLAFAKPIKLK